MTDEQWMCMVAHRAPLDKSCAKEYSPVAGEGACGGYAGRGDDYHNHVNQAA